jgi:folate-binding protein YgfZ
MSASFTVLPDRAVFEISGKDSRHFLQGLVTADVENLTERKAAHAGLLTPQGKIMFDFFIIGQPRGFVVDCDAGQVDDIVKRLTFYKLRAKVDIRVKPDMGVAAVLGDADMAGDGLVFDDPRLTAMGKRVIAAKPDLSSKTNATPQEYLVHRLKLGIADSADIGRSKTFPHEANFDQLGGVSFTKGCYVGQEVVSRMQHRGTARSRIMPVTFNGEMNVENAEIRAAGKKIGQMLSTADGLGLALIRLDRASSAIQAGEALEAGGKILTVSKPEWANFDFL